MIKNVFIVGFMLFAIFFGAGNLIFPPNLGLNSGADFWPAISGFVLTGVGLPLLALIVAAHYEGGYKKALENIHPVISLLLLGAIYLTIGPFFAIPRTAATAYDMAMVPFLESPSTVSLLIFTFVYFAITLWVSLNPTKMVDRIGAVLTPVLLIAIIALVIKAIMIFSGVELGEKVHTMKAPFFNGFIEGYQTMDAIAAFAFSVLVVNAIKAKSHHTDSLIKQTILASLVSAVALGVIYILIGWIGNHIPLTSTEVADASASGQNLGTFILNETATRTFGDLGRTLLGIIVTLACLTTSIGLVVSTSAYFNNVFPKISYKIYAIIFTLIGFGLANQGLNEVIKTSIPVLLVLYPISMTVLLVLLVNIFISIPKTAQGFAIILVTAVSICSVIGFEFTTQLPLKEYSMEWLPFAVLGVVVGLVFHFFSKKESH